ncbi:melanocyte-stimulating hormone receptor-like [Oculina patagonica]
MANSTKDGNHTTVQEILCQTSLNGMHQKIFISALNISLSVTAFLGNVLIIVSLQKVSSVHPPSKLLLGCLASTDLCVGLITQPLFVVYKMSSQPSKRCQHLGILFDTIGLTFCGVSLLTLTAISVDRLLALLLGLRYRQVVTLRRVWAFVVSVWLSCAAVAILRLYTFRISLTYAFIVLFLCIVTSTYCYIKIYLTLRHHQTQVQDHVQQGQQNGGGIALNIARYRKTVSSALWIQMTLLACYLPYAIFVAAVLIPGLHTPSLNFAWAITISLLLLNSSINPLLYCWKMRMVRQAVKETIRQFCCFSS